MPRPFPTETDSKYLRAFQVLQPRATVETHRTRGTESLGRMPWASMHKEQTEGAPTSPDKTETFMYRIPWVFRTCARCFIAKSSPAFKSLHYCSGAENTHDSASPCGVLTRQGYSRATISQHPLPQPRRMTSHVARKGEHKFMCNLLAVPRRRRMASPSYPGWSLSCHHLGPCVEDAGRG